MTGTRKLTTGLVNRPPIGYDPGVWLDADTLHADSKSTIAVVPSRRCDSEDRAAHEALANPKGLRVHRLGLTVAQRHVLLSDVTFNAGPRSLTAIIGPSGAGKTTLAKLIAGTITPTAGAVTFAGHDVHAEYPSLRCRIGLVPQDDVVHRQLTVEQALGYAAELRLPHASTEGRQRSVEQVLRELELTEHAQKRVDTLSGGQRKRASVALELLTSPSLLILDEPTTGLDPALDAKVMTRLRQLADTGLIVLVITHSLTYLHVCDQLLLLAPGGKTAYCGPPGEIASVMGTANWADIFAKVTDDPDAAHLRFLERVKPPLPVPESQKPAQLCGPTHTSLWRQFSTIARRQVRLVAADCGYFAFLTILPFILGTLSLVVPGLRGLGTADVRGPTPNEPADIVMLLNISAIFMGAALTIRDVVGERVIFRRERAAGLSASAYLVAKIVVYSIAAALQSAVLVAIVVIGKGGPTRGAVILGNPILELYVTLAATAAVSAIMGLALSAAATSQDQILPMLVVSVMLSIVFSGGLIPVTGRIVLDQLSWLLPARWGFAASASTVDLRTIAPLVPANENLWTHNLHWWVSDMAVLTGLGIVLAVCVRWRIRLKRCNPSRLRVPTPAFGRSLRAGRGTAIPRLQSISPRPARLTQCPNQRARVTLPTDTKRTRLGRQSTTSSYGSDTGCFGDGLLAQSPRRARLFWSLTACGLLLALSSGGALPHRVVGYMSRIQRSSRDSGCRLTTLTRRLGFRGDDDLSATLPAGSNYTVEVRNSQQLICQFTRAI